MANVNIGYMTQFFAQAGFASVRWPVFVFVFAAIGYWSPVQDRPPTSKHHCYGLRPHERH
jgi:hypothetical protein